VFAIQSDWGVNLSSNNASTGGLGRFKYSNRNLHVLMKAHVTIKGQTETARGREVCKDDVVQREQC
jgi:hypothetical protein